MTALQVEPRLITVTMAALGTLTSTLAPVDAAARRFTPPPEVVTKAVPIAALLPGAGVGEAAGIRVGAAVALPCEKDKKEVITYPEYPLYDVAHQTEPLDVIIRAVPLGMVAITLALVLAAWRRFRLPPEVVT